MATKIEAKILGTLIDSYERSKTFTGDNLNEQKFKIATAKLFPQYDDDSEFDLYKEINNTLQSLKAKCFVDFTPERSGTIKTVFLVKDSIGKIYQYIKREPKANVNEQLQKIWHGYELLDKTIYAPLLEYIGEQSQRLKENKNILVFDGDLGEYQDILLAVKNILGNESEVFIRELSVKLFNSSKRLEEIESKVRTLLYKYGEYAEKETVLEEHNIIKTPTYVMVKGTGILDCGQKIDLSKIGGDIGLSTQTLKTLTSIELNGASVITIENLTNFHKYIPNNELVIYLGGFHNTVKRELIKLVAKCNPSATFRHFGDVDAGGFYILEHLKEKTGVNFLPANMDMQTLAHNKNHWKKLTENDRKRLGDLAKKYFEHDAVAKFMLDNNCKLEQESEIL